MSQDLREMLANRRFAIPLIILLGFCFVGLILIGIVLILRPGSTGGGEEIADMTATAVAATTSRPTMTPLPTKPPTARPTATMVPVGTPVGSGTQGTPVSSATGEATASPTLQATAQATATPQATTAPTDDELADTGVGWGLILFSAVGLAMVALVARRLRMVQH
jgi:hypothetical protein